MPERYSIWLMPDNASSDRLRKVMAMLSKEYGSPAFEPHLTLVGVVEKEQEYMVQGARQIAKRLSKMELVFDGIGYSNKYSKAVFLKVLKTPELMAANEMAAGIIGAEKKEYDPHVSLMYSGLPLERLSGIAKEVEEKESTTFTFSVERLRLHLTAVKTENWKPVAEFVLY